MQVGYRRGGCGTEDFEGGNRLGALGGGPSETDVEPGLQSRDEFELFLEFGVAGVEHVNQSGHGLVPHGLERIASLLRGWGGLLTDERFKPFVQRPALATQFIGREHVDPPGREQYGGCDETDEVIGAFHGCGLREDSLEAEGKLVENRRGKNGPRCVCAATRTWP